MVLADGRANWWRTFRGRGWRDHLVAQFDTDNMKTNHHKKLQYGIFICAGRLTSNVHPIHGFPQLFVDLLWRQPSVGLGAKKGPASDGLDPTRFSIRKWSKRQQTLWKGFEARDKMQSGMLAEYTCKISEQERKQKYFLFCFRVLKRDTSKSSIFMAGQPICTLFMLHAPSLRPNVLCIFQSLLGSAFHWACRVVYKWRPFACYLERSSIHSKRPKISRHNERCQALCLGSRKEGERRLVAKNKDLFFFGGQKCRQTQVWSMSVSTHLSLSPQSGSNKIFIRGPRWSLKVHHGQCLTSMNQHDSGGSQSFWCITMIVTVIVLSVCFVLNNFIAACRLVNIVHVLPVL
jgi:hypothetical protein